MKTLAIIGAGFSGTITAIQFLRMASPGVRVILIDRSENMAQGVAYGTSSPRHLLNIPVGNMSALADEADSFLRFCQGRLPNVTASAFVSRKLYGEYLTSLLGDAESHCREGLSLQRMVAEVCRLRSRQDGVSVELDNGETLHVDHVVLACGHFSPVDPSGVAPAAAAERYQRDPWKEICLPESDVGRPVLLLGSGLTALDVALGLLQQGHRGGIHMLSRRGLSPLAHREQRSMCEVPSDFGDRFQKALPTVCSYLFELRRAIKRGISDGVDWRDLLAALRPFTPELWRRLPEVEQRRFLRHIQPYWDVHRHRVAPAAYQAFQEALSTGRIQLMAGRLKVVEADAQGLRVSVQLRSGGQTALGGVAQIVNCTGPNSDLCRVSSPLINQLREEGLVQRDPHGLGMCVDERLAVKNVEGDSSLWLSYIGPMLKANLWEATAVPELRVHAKILASRLADSFRG